MTDLDSKKTWEIEDRATQEAALGAHAIGVGDTVVAREHYSAAGYVLKNEASAARDAAKRHLLYFLAASQYFHGGDYGQAQKLARRVEERFLAEQDRQLLRPFLRDVEQRANASYVPSMRTKIRELGESGKFTECLELLKKHPFVLERPQLSFARAIISEEQKRYQAAAIHHARALKFDPENPGWPYTATALVMWLPSAGREPEAFEYLQFLLKEVKHPVAKIAASTLHYRKASASDGEERRDWLRKQIDYFREARDEFPKLPESHQQDTHLREMMSLCFELAAFAYWKLDDIDKALQITTEGIEFDDKVAGLWLVRGMIQEGKRERFEDYRKAIRLGEQSYIPHYHLAQDDLEMGHFEQALRHIEDALVRGPSAQMTGVLLSWKAICLANTDSAATVTDVIRLFEKAVELAPEIPEVKENYEVFREFADKATLALEMKKRRGYAPKIKDPVFLDTKPKFSQKWEFVAA